MKSFALFSVLISTALAVELSVRSNCPETVWLATQPNSDQGPLPDGVVALAPGASYTYQVSVSMTTKLYSQLIFQDPWKWLGR